MRRLSTAFFVFCAFLLALGATPSAHADTFATGDLVVFGSGGSLSWLRADGTLVQTLDPGVEPGGAAFDSGRRLYVTGGSTNKVVRFDSDGVLLGTFIEPFHPNPDDLRGQPSEIAFDSSGNAFVGDAGTFGGVRKFDASAAFVAQAFGGESDVLGLGSDGCTLARGGNDNQVVARIDCSGAISSLDDSVSRGIPTGMAVLPDGSVVITWSALSHVTRYAADWTVLAEYDAPDCVGWSGVELGADGTTFWSSCRTLGGGSTSTPYEIDLATGSVVRSLATSGVVVAVAPGAWVPPVQTESCVYDPVTRSVTATIAQGSQATLKVVGGQLHFGLVPIACGTATTTNTVSISIAGMTGSNETLTLDQRGGIFAPGAESEHNIPEIEIATVLGDATDTVVVYATEGPDMHAAGQFGFATNTDGDVDWTFSPAALRLEVHMLGGDDYFNGRGQNGAGLHFLGPIVATGGEGSESLLRGSSDPDVLDGGPGNDNIRGEESADVIDGGPGDDTIGAGDGDDIVTGGPGLDSFAGSGGNDVFNAQDDEADTQFSGGAGTDTAYVDTGLDAKPVAVENVIGDGPPPPPPPTGPCVYDAASRSVTATIAAGQQATLSVIGGAIHFGATPVACGAATTTNTDTISITGATGSNETLTLDQRGRARSHLVWRSRAAAPRSS